SPPSPAPPISLAVPATNHIPHIPPASSSALDHAPSVPHNHRSGRLANNRKQTTRQLKATHEKELRNSLDEFNFEGWGPAPPRVVYSSDEVVIRTELAAMEGYVLSPRRHRPRFSLIKPTTSSASVHWASTSNGTPTRQIPTDRFAPAALHSRKFATPRPSSSSTSRSWAVNISRNRCDPPFLLIPGLPDASPSLQGLIEDRQRIKVGVQIAGALVPPDTRSAAGLIVSPNR
ncbi:hypothetical protein P7C70_g3654, partial [Phenoliferia sp. Uapishka_3]